uniref:DUF6900 domain-containing protein n=1 Tax=Magnetococcus massalia (strain MO-1) TaxID=451514 RepID=A0A1S7LKD3_MAGMO|nr:Conserved protein of unknown function [Candidatus Magnetococcus massalia]
MTIQLTDTQRTIIEAAAQHTDGSINPLPERIKGGATVKVINALETKGLIKNVSLNPLYANWILTDAAYEAIGQVPPAPAKAQCIDLLPTEEELTASFDGDAEAEEPQCLSDNQIIDNIEAEQAKGAGMHKDPKAEIFNGIALDHLFIDTLEIRNSDSLDFHNVSVWGVKSALEAAYQAGVKAAQRKTPRSRGARANSKQAKIIEMMQRQTGATLVQVSDETGWNKNTIRGSISSTLRKKLGLNVTRERVDGVTTYRITSA